jgi:Uma2 family endonuclease
MTPPEVGHLGRHALSIRRQQVEQRDIEGRQQALAMGDADECADHALADGAQVVERVGVEGDFSERAPHSSRAFTRTAKPCYSKAMDSAQTGERSDSLVKSARQALRFRLGPTLKKMTDHELFELCQLNHDWRIERTSEGEIIAMPPTGGQTGRLSFELARVFGAWVEADGTGIGFDSSTGFILPNRAERSPDLAWVSRTRWDGPSEEEKEEFPPLCPDFVLELRSRSDSLAVLRDKMREYIANGARLGWLIDPIEHRVYVYRPDQDEICLDDPTSVSGDPILHGFMLEPRRLWS